MNSEDKRAIKFWSGVVFFMVLLMLWGLFGCSEGAKQSTTASAAPVMEANDQPAEKDWSKFQFARDAFSDVKVKLGIMDPDGTKVTRLERFVRTNMADFQAWKERCRLDYQAQLEAEQAAAEAEAYYYTEQAQYSGGYSGGSTTSDLYTLLNGQGRAIGSDGTNYTFYYYDIGNGPIDYRIPGCYFDENGVAHDGEGYIAVARSDYNPDEPVVAIDTDYGPARIYDKCGVDGTVDVYTNK